MKMNCWKRLIVMALLGAAALTSMGASVRNVDFSETPAMEEFARKARELGDAVYPKVLELMAPDPSHLPGKFDLIFKPRLPMGGGEVPAYCSGDKIYLSADWFTKHPDDFGAVVHEMTHVAQVQALGSPGYWVEGVADFVRHKLGYTNSWSYPHCAAQYPHYTSGYWCTSAFLTFLDSKYGLKVIHELNAAMEKSPFSEAFFVNVTGKPIEELWAEFQKTAYYPESAARAYETQLKRAANETESCRAQLLQIHTAIDVYRKEHQDLPEWLSDLTPKYIADTNALICPVTKRSGRTASFGLADPVIAKSYLYEFSGAKVPWRNEEGLTMKAFKMRQKELIGVGIPMLRCHLHEPVLNVSYHGRLFTSGTGWEILFTNAAVRLEDLSAGRRPVSDQKK